MTGNSKTFARVKGSLEGLNGVKATVTADVSTETKTHGACKAVNSHGKISGSADAFEFGERVKYLFSSDSPVSVTILDKRHITAVFNLVNLEALGSGFARACTNGTIFFTGTRIKSNTWWGMIRVGCPDFIGVITIFGYFTGKMFIQ